MAARFLEELGYHTQPPRNGPPALYYTTGFSKDEIVELCVLVRAAAVGLPGNTWPPILGLFKSVVVALTYLRRNRAQAELGETFGVIPADDQPRDFWGDALAGQGAQRVCAHGRRA